MLFLHKHKKSSDKTTVERIQTDERDLQKNDAKKPVTKELR